MKANFMKGIGDKEARAEKKRIKTINHSVVATGSKNQKSMGLYGIQMDDGVFYLANGNYIKVYMVMMKKRNEVARKDLIDAIVNSTDERARITMLRRKENEEGTEFHTFISFHTYAKTYYEAAMNFSEKEAKFSGFTEDVKLGPADIATFLTFSKEYFNRREGEFDIKESIRKNRDMMHDLVPEIEDGEKYLIANNQNIEGFLVTQFCEQVENLNEGFEKLKCQACGVIDIEPVTEEDLESYRKNLEIGYNQPVDAEIRGKLNVTVAYVLAAPLEEQLGHEGCKLKKAFNESEIMLSACNEMTKELFDSIATFGVRDYRAMKLMDKDCIKEFVF